MSSSASNQWLPSEEGFLALPADQSVGDFLATVIPFPMECTVSWKSGTDAGPDAILEASHQVELFDEFRMAEPVDGLNVRTRRSVVPAATSEAALNQLAGIVQEELFAGAFPLTLGGEHALTAGAIRPFAEKYSDLTIVQIDAHADLRDGYDGEHYSHAAAMRRCLDAKNVSLVSFGIRNISAEEIPFLKANDDRIDMFWAWQKADWDLSSVLQRLADKPIYLTVDVDGFDSSLMPATGTPEPGGLFWFEVVNLIRKISSVGRLVAADIVELAPSPGLHACDFLAAKLGYEILNCARESQLR